MTKKDFVLIAKVLRVCRETAEQFREDNTANRAYKKKILAWQSVIAKGFMHELKTTNPLFDAERFLKACGENPELAN